MKTTSENPAAMFWVAGAVLILAIAVIYSNSMGVPFLLDDQHNIIGNSSIRNFNSPHKVLFAAPGTGIAGRPLANVSFAVNWAISGPKVWSYHLLNIIIHIMAALVLFGLLHRAFTTGKLLAFFGRRAFFLALSCSLVWAVHPLQTESVTYISQRVESLMGLFFLLVLYTAAKGFDSPKKGLWHGLSVLFFILGVCTKEVIVAAPVCVLCYDVILGGNSIRQAVRRSFWLYTGYAFGLLLLAALVLAGGTRSAGPISRTVTPIEYAFSQLCVIIHYIRLSFWPSPLCFDYSPGLKDFFLPAWTCGLLVSGLVAGTLYLLWRKNPAALLGVFFFTVLAPTSSILPMGYSVLEHRMYLPLAAVIISAVLIVYAGARRFGEKFNPRLWILGIVLVAVWAVALGAATHARNRDYASALAIWSDTLKNNPENWRANHGMAQALAALGRTEEAMAWYKKAISIKPDYAAAHNDLGVLFFQAGKAGQAIPHFREAIRIHPGYMQAFSNLGSALASLGKRNEAKAFFQKALALNPKSAEAHRNMGILLSEENNPAAAVEHFEKALSLEPGSKGLKFLLGEALLDSGRFPEAEKHLGAYVAARPGDAEAWELLARAFALSGKQQDAVMAAETARRLRNGTGAAAR